MSNETEHSQDIKKLAAMIKAIDFGMLTTVAEDGTLHSRPMSANSHVEFDGDVWFFTSAKSFMVLETQRNPQANVSFADPKNQCYVSLSGTAELVRDRAKIEELWEPSLTAWFPGGKDDPEIALLKINVHRAEYWDAPSSFVAHAVSLAKAVATGQPASPGENKKIDPD